MGGTALSVLIATWNRPTTVRVSVESVLGAELPVEFEIVLVDDGSEPGAAAALDELAASDPRIRLVRQANAGLSAARIRGAAVAQGRWLTFLDDDDWWLQGWSEMVRFMDEPDTGAVSGAALLLRPDGTTMGVLPPKPLGPVFSGITANFLPGCFAIRRDVYESAGGYLPGLSSSHQTELCIRCGAVCAELGLRVRHVSAPVAAMERRPRTDRALTSPELHYAGTRWILARHAEHLSLDPVIRSNFEAVAAANAARLGDSSATTHATRALRANPRNLRAWPRVAATATPIWRQRWRRADASRRAAPPQTAPLKQAASFWGTSTAALCSHADLLFLPWRYRENSAETARADRTVSGARGADRDEVRHGNAVYRWAARLARRSPTRVLGIGFGSGDEFARRFPEGNWIGADLDADHWWNDAGDLRPDLVVCADVIEQIEDPLGLLVGLATTVSSGGSILLSTPDRARLENADPLGPPTDLRHIREWTEPELRLLVEAAGLRVVLVRHLSPPRTSSPTRALHRATFASLRGWAPPRRHTTMAFLLTVGDTPEPEHRPHPTT